MRYVIENEYGERVVGSRLYLSTLVKPGTYEAVRYDPVKDDRAKGTLVVLHKGLAEFYRDGQ